MARESTTIFFAVILVAVLGATAMQVPPLPKMNLNPNTITVSGISAGGAMAVQVEYAFSKTIKAAGVVAGVPFQCSGGLLQGALTCMGDPELVYLPVMEARVKSPSSLGVIDDWRNILNHTVTLFSGTRDTVVAQGTMMALDQVYRLLGQPAERRLHYFNYSAEHAWITNFYGNACGYKGEPFLNNCGLDFAESTLRRGAEAMGIKWESKPGKFNAAHMYEFDQSSLGASKLISLDSIGFLYVPAQCKSGSTQCHLHINFHGCEQYRDTVGRVYVDHTGLNEWAETNNIVVVYPQTVDSQLVPYNPKGCFDWWGYSSPLYALKAGPQMKFVANIINTLTGVQP